MDGKRKIDINAASIVGLKAELFRKQEQFKKERLQNASSSVRPKPISKKPSIWSKKNAGVQSRAEKDYQLTSEEEDTLAKSQSILEAKAKLYEKMTTGQTMPDESTNERFLVDFEKKVIDKIAEDRNKEKERPEDDNEGVMASVPTREEMMKKETKEAEEEESDIPPAANADEEWVDYVDTLGRSRRCMRKDLPKLINMDKDLNPDKFKEQEKKDKLGTESLPDLLSEDMYCEMLRKKWEAEEEEAAKKGPGPMHYQNVKFDEVREMGVGYFDFSKDETERQEQMESLQMLRDETVDQRVRREQLKAKRKAAMQARLAKVKQRKKLKGEIPGADDENEESREDESVKKKDPMEERLSRDADKSYDMLMGRREKKKPVREWDIGKEPNLWEEAKKKARDERLSDFAPPSVYFDSAPPQKRRQQPSKSQTYLENLTRLQGQTSSSDSVLSSETNFASGGFQAFQSTRKPQTVPSTPRKPQTVSSNPRQSQPVSSTPINDQTRSRFEDKVRTHATSSVGTVPNQRVSSASDVGQKVVNEESINQSLSYFRNKASQSK